MCRATPRIEDSSRTEREWLAFLLWCTSTRTRSGSNPNSSLVNSGGWAQLERPIRRVWSAVVSLLAKQYVQLSGAV